MNALFLGGLKSFFVNQYQKFTNVSLNYGEGGSYLTIKCLFRKTIRHDSDVTDNNF